MGRVVLSEDVTDATRTYGERFVRLQLSARGSAINPEFVDAMRAWTVDFDRRWSFQDGAHLTPDDLYVRELNVQIGPSQSLPDGSIIVDIAKFPSDDVYLQIVEDLVETLSQLDFDTAIQLYRPTRPMLGRRGVPVTTTAVWASPLLLASAQNRPPGPGFAPAVRWRDVQPGITAALVEQAALWCSAIEQATYFIEYDGLTRWVAREAVVAELTRALQDAGQEGVANVDLIAEAYPDAARSVTFGRSADLLYHDLRFADRDYDSAQNAAAVATDLLSELTAHVSSAVALRSDRPTSDLHGLIPPSIWPQRYDRPPDNGQNLRVLYDRWLVDAFPIVFLGAEFPRIAANEVYDMTPLGHGLLLITRSLQDWFSGVRPDADIVNAARAALDELILNDETYRWLVNRGRQSWSKRNPSA